METFQKMFGKKRQVVQSYMETIIDLPHCSQIGLKSFLNKLETAVRSVKEYGVQQEQISPCIIPMVERKLQPEDFRKWKELIFEDDGFSLDKFIKFLHERLLCQPPGDSASKPQTARPRTPQTTAFLASGCKP